MTDESRMSTFVQMINVSGICRRVAAVGGRRTLGMQIFQSSMEPKREVRQITTI